METAIISMWCKLEETFKTRGGRHPGACQVIEYGLCKELNAKVEETQLELQMFLDPQTRHLRGERADTKKDFQDEFRSEIETTWHKFRTQLKEV
jgi:hypothetical protein